VKLLAAPNALKGSLSAQRAAEAIAQGARRASSSMDVIELPVADGGDGTLDVLLANLGGEAREVEVHDPLGRTLRARYGLIDCGRTALLDVATASGHARLRDSERDPLRASSYGTGELMRAALASGCERLVIGLGGSATVDGGLGLLAALGIPGLDASGHAVALGGAGLSELTRFDARAISSLTQGRELVCLCDVETRLTGPDGALLYAAQKGADARAEAVLGAGLERLAVALEAQSGVNARALVSGGAAGGIAATLCTLLGARLVPGIDFVLDQARFERKLAGAALVITAEGRLDRQSAFNKGPFGVARRARAAGVPTVVLAGSIADDFELEATPFAAALAIGREALTLDEARTHASSWLSATSEHALRLYLLAREAPRRP